MGLENPIHLLVLAVIILLVFGSSQLPKIARSAGKHAREAKDGVASFKGEFDNAPGRRRQPDHAGHGHDSLGQSEEHREGHGQQDRESHQEAAGRAPARAPSA